MAPTGDWRLRLAVHLERKRLDREIANGGSVEGSRARFIRARQLISARSRAAIAAGLLNILDAAEEKAADICSPVHVDHVAALAERRALEDLAARLTEAATATPRGVALAELLLSDSCSPLRRPVRGRPLRQALAEIAAAL